MEASIWTALEGPLVSVLPEAIPAIHFCWKQKRGELMNIRRAGRKVVKNLHKGYGIYRIGFVNIYGEEDETELDVMNINDLEKDYGCPFVRNLRVRETVYAMWNG